MDLLNLDYAAIIKMYIKLNNQEKLEEMLDLALKNYNGRESDYEFLRGYCLSDDLFLKYQNNKTILKLFLVKDVKPRKKVYDLIAKFLDFREFKEMVKKEMILPEYFEAFVIKGRNIKDYAEIFGDEQLLAKLDFNKLYDSFGVLPYDCDNSYYCDAIENIILKVNGNNTIKQDLVNELIRYQKDVILQGIIFATFNNHCSTDYEEYIKDRYYLILIINYFKKNNKNIFSGSDGYNKYLENLIIEIKEGKINDIAWAIYVHSISDDVLIDILNFWANHDKVLEFETYFPYFREENITTDRYYACNGKGIDLVYNQKKNTFDVARTRKPE